MKRLMGLTAGKERGFTLVELIVVIAILGILATIAVPTIASYLSSSKQQAYTSDRERIQAALDAYFSRPSNVRFVGMRQYPTLAEITDGAPGVFVQPDEDTVGGIITIDGNPLGSSEGGSPRWIDNGNGIRDAIVEEVLNDEDVTTSEGWHVATVTRQGAEYIVDTRDFFIDFDKLVAAGFLEDVPATASRDNTPDIAPSGVSDKYDGSYSWFVDGAGRVGSLLFYFPEPDNTGFQGRYP
jgi:prepilin-type N-terminal cleavage/methylation domain-containing protein